MEDCGRTGNHAASNARQFRQGELYKRVPIHIQGVYCYMLTPS